MTHELSAVRSASQRSCVVCGTGFCAVAWLQERDGYLFTCDVCGSYALDSLLHDRLRQLRTAPEKREPSRGEFALLPGLQRAIAAAHNRGESVPLFSIDTWRAEALAED